MEVELKFGNLEMLFVEAPFDQALAEIKAANGQLATAQQVAQARMVGGKEHHVSKYGSWTAENFVYFPSGKILATYADYSPILKHPKEATEAHRNGEEFYISKEEAKNLEEMAKEDSNKKPSEQRVYTFNKTKSYEIPISKFAKDKLAQFIFKEADAKKYAEFLQEAGIKEVPVWLVNSNYVKKRKTPFARPLWFHYLLNWSGLCGSNGLLVYYDWARGVRVASEASTAQKIDKLEIDEFDKKQGEILQEIRMNNKLTTRYGVKSLAELDEIVNAYRRAQVLFKGKK